MSTILGLFEGYGIEIETMVVDAETLDIRPIVDDLLKRGADTEAYVGEVEDGAIAWSNEFVAHVVELKTNGPAPDWTGLEHEFRRSSKLLNDHLATWNAMLLPTAMHPWMNPVSETKFWPHDYSPIYRAYHSMFDARRHGWANLQSVHLNLPFADEQEFARLMAAIRIVLPLIPALAASSPIVEGRDTGILDNRLHFYRTNSERVAAMTGQVIPEPIFDVKGYRDGVFAAIDRELVARGASEVLLGNEWTNARGAIARFDRMAIEIRLIDAQECSAADLAVACAVSNLVRGLVDGRWSTSQAQRAVPSAPLVAQLVDTIQHGPESKLTCNEIAACFGVERKGYETVGELVRAIVPASFDGPAELEPALEAILEDGVLSQRILRALGPDFDRDKLRGVYRELASCLIEGRSYRP